MHCERSRLSEEHAELAAERLGCCGRSQLIEALPYADAGLWFRLPTANVVVEGVGKDLWGLLLQRVNKGETRRPWVMPNGSKAELRERGMQMRLTHDFERPYR